MKEVETYIGKGLKECKRSTYVMPSDVLRKKRKQMTVRNKFRNLLKWSLMQNMKKKKLKQIMFMHVKNMRTVGN